MASNEDQSPLQINDLLPAVGNWGRYQAVVIIISSFLALQNGMIYITSGYNYAVAPYSQCPAPHQGVSLCTQYVCSLPYSQRAQYENPQIAYLTTLGNQFGDYHCQREYQISVAMGLVWVGALVGAVIFTIIADNNGRRIAMLLTQLLNVVGLTITLLSPTLLMADFGMLILGASLASSFTIALCFLR
jgi:MFS family permease